MEMVKGQKVTSLTPLVRQEIDGPGLALELFRAYLHQILIDGFFHADPHPGNVFLTDDGRIALLDLGMVSRSDADAAGAAVEAAARGFGRGRRQARRRSPCRWGRCARAHERSAPAPRRPGTSLDVQWTRRSSRCRSAALPWN